MPSTLLNLATPTTGTESGTWGDLVNNGLTSYLDIAIAGQLAITITTTDVTLTNTSGTNAATGITSTTAQYAILNITGAKTAARNLNLPASSRQYLINNNGTGGFLLTVRGATPTTGVKLIDGEKAVVAWNGTDYVKIASTPFNMGTGSGNIDSNVVYGKGALAANTTGNNNVAIGINTLAANTTGQLNTAIGGLQGALSSNTTADGNTAIGADAFSKATTGGSNTGVGMYAGRYTTTGYQNIVMGWRAFENNLTGYSNIAIGTYAMTNSTTAYSNIGIGGACFGSSGFAGSSNISIGQGGQAFCTTGSANISIGDNALQSNQTGSGHIAIGSAALLNSTSSTSSIAVGNAALRTSTSGVYNTAFGDSALYSNTTGSYNVAFGLQALYFNTTGSGNTAINPNGAPVFNPTTQDNRFCMGSTSVTNAYIQVAWTVVSDARDKTDFAPVPHGLDFVCKLKPTAYRYKENREATEGHGPLRYGFKAQEVLAEEGANPVIVDNEDPEKLRFNDQSMIAVLVNAIKEQTQIIKTLSDRVAQLESKA